MIHSQFDEENIILEFFKDKSDGIVLDIGAYNPVTFSNSRALINKGWSAVLVEPSPRCFSTIMRFYENETETKDRVKLVNAFVGSEYGLIEFHDSEGAVATADKSHFEAWSQYQKDFKTIWIPKIPGNALQSVVTKCDFINIDCEGGDFQVLISLPLGSLQPSLVCIEYGSDGMNIVKYMNAIGYSEHYHNQANLFFKKEWK